jgi:serine/threonine protein kinase
VSESSRPSQRKTPAPAPPTGVAKSASSKSSVLADVNETSFTYLKVLGQGSFGKVLMAEHRTSKDVFAVKVWAGRRALRCVVFGMPTGIARR